MKYRYVLEFETDADLSDDARLEMEQRLSVQIEVISDGDLDCMEGERMSVRYLSSDRSPVTESEPPRVEDGHAGRAFLKRKPNADTITTFGALVIAHDLLTNLLTDSQLDFVQPQGWTARDCLLAIGAARVREEAHYTDSHGPDRHSPHARTPPAPPHPLLPPPTPAPPPPP